MKKILTIVVILLMTTVSCTKMVTNNRIEGTWTSDYSALTYTQTYDNGYVIQDEDTAYTYEVFADKTIRYYPIQADGSLGEPEEYIIVDISKKEMTIDYGTGERTWTKVE